MATAKRVGRARRRQGAARFAKEKLVAVRAAAAHSFPAAGIGRMLSEIAAGYLNQTSRRSGHRARTRS